MSGREERGLQELQRKRRQRQRWGMIAHMADGVEPMEADAPEDQEKSMEVDPPLTRLPRHSYTMTGVPSMTPWQRHHHSARPVPHHGPGLHTQR